MRATAIDLLQYGWPTLVPRERADTAPRRPHDANLFDIQAKNADVVSVDEAIAYVESVRRARSGRGEPLLVIGVVALLVLGYRELQDEAEALSRREDIRMVPERDDRGGRRDSVRPSVHPSPTRTARPSS